MGAAGSDVAINSATIALMNNDLQRLPFLIRLSRRTIGVIHQNLLFGVVFIVGFEILAGMGWIQAGGRGRAAHGGGDVRDLQQRPAGAVRRGAAPLGAARGADGPPRLEAVPAS